MSGEGDTVALPSTTSLVQYLRANGIYQAVVDPLARCTFGQFENRSNRFATASYSSREPVYAISAGWWSFGL